MTTAIAGDFTCARIAQRLAQAVGPHRYKVWFDRSARLDYQPEESRLVIAVPNRFVADWIGRNFQADLRAAARSETGRDVAVDLRIDPAPFVTAAPLPPAASAESSVGPHRHQPGHGIGHGSQDPRAASSASAARPSLLNHRAAAGDRHPPLRYRLEDFVVGPSNELAYSAAAHLAEDDNAANPLFIHGGVGLGKTHLLQGVCRRLLELRPESRVLYTTGEQFTNEFLTAIRTNKLEPFRRGIRRLDLLAIDDVHFLANKEKTQQEFLHSFDAIELSGARVVLASDNHPKLIQQFSEALVSRCVRGLVVDVREPDTATRIKIVRALAQRRGLSLMETVVAALAARCQGSVREIEGTLTRLQALSQLTMPVRAALALRNPDTLAAPVFPTAQAAAVEAAVDAAPLTVLDEPLMVPAPRCATGNAPGGPSAPASVPEVSPRLAAPATWPAPPAAAASAAIGHALINRLFGPEFENSNPRAVHFEAILAAVAQRTGITRAQILSAGRQRPLVVARSLVVYLARQLTPQSFPEIASALGKASHSTVIAADQRIRTQAAKGTMVVVPPRAEAGPGEAHEEIALADLIDQVQRLIQRA